MVKRAFSVNGTSKPNDGGKCTNCDATGGCTAYFSSYKRLCAKCCCEDKGESFECFMIPNKKCLKTLFNDFSKFKKDRTGVSNEEERSYKMGKITYNYRIASTTGGYLVYF